MSANETMNSPQSVSFSEAVRFWLKLGFISFGGPAGQISVMHQELVERKRWISAFIGLAAFIALFRYKVPIIPAVGACAAAGLVLTLSTHI